MRTIKLFSFSELSEDAQKVAVECMRDRVSEDAYDGEYESMKLTFERYGVHGWRGGGVYHVRPTNFEVIPPGEFPLDVDWLDDTFLEAMMRHEGAMKTGWKAVENCSPWSEASYLYRDMYERWLTEAMQACEDVIEADWDYFRSDGYVRAELENAYDFMDFYENGHPFNNA